METITPDTIEKQIEMAAPLTRVWTALTDSQQFGEWFMVKFDGPFVAGEPLGGNMTYPGYEHMRLDIVVKTIEPETYFSYTWHPFAIDPSIDYSQETPTLVEFRLSPTTAGTLLTVTESGFDNIPEARRAKAFEMDSGGWEQQMENIKTYVDSNP